MEMKIIVIWCIINEAHQVWGSVLGPEDTAVNRMVFVLQECTAWWGDTGVPSNTRQQHLRERLHKALWTPRADHGRLPGGGHA